MRPCSDLLVVPREHDDYGPSYIREFHMLVRDSCVRCKGTVWPHVSRHDLVVLLHMRPSQARRLDNIRESSVSPS